MVQREKPVVGLGGALIVVALIAAFTILGVAEGDDFIIPTLVVGGGLAAYLTRTEVGKALAHRIRYGRQSLAEQVPPELYGELDELRARVLELEDRLDFTERLIARPREAERVQDAESA